MAALIESTRLAAIQQKIAPLPALAGVGERVWEDGRLDVTVVAYSAYSDGQKIMKIMELKQNFQLPCRCVVRRH